MEVLADLSPLFTAGIFFVGTMSFLLLGVNAMLSPLKKDIAKLEAGQIQLNKRMDGIEAKLDRVLAIEAKLDQLLAKSG